MNEKELKLTTLEMALEDLDRIIESMKKNDYPHVEVNEYVKKRWNTWNEITKVRRET